MATVSFKEIVMVAATAFPAAFVAVMAYAAELVPGLAIPAVGAPVILQDESRESPVGRVALEEHAVMADPLAHVSTFGVMAGAGEGAEFPVGYTK